MSDQSGSPRAEAQTLFTGIGIPSPWRRRVARAERASWVPGNPAVWREPVPRRPGRPGLMLMAEPEE